VAVGQKLTYATPRPRARRLGEHGREVVAELLCHTDEAIDELIAPGVLP
jgi:hypothetical protein